MATLINKKGFTLVEIMIVVAIIALIASLAIPGLLRARLTASEAAATANLKNIRDACINYYSSLTPPNYPPNLATLGAAVPQYIDNSLSSATGAGNPKQGYFYIYNRVNNFQFTCTAVSIVAGGRQFFVDESGVIRLNGAGGNPI